jgi:hypothetical protein
MFLMAMTDTTGAFLKLALRGEVYDRNDRRVES